VCGCVCVGMVCVVFVCGYGVCGVFFVCGICLCVCV